MFYLVSYGDPIQDYLGCRNTQYAVRYTTTNAARFERYGGSKLMVKKKRKQTTTQKFSQRSSGIPHSVSFSDENGMRDFIFRNYKETFAELIKGQKPNPKWKTAGFPPVRFLIQHDAERRINRVVDDLESLVLD